MSLINQMLQDLDTRRAAEAGAGLPNDVRPLPKVRRSRGSLISGLGLAGLVLVGGLLWQVLELRSALERQAAASTAAALAPALAPVAVVTPAITPPPQMPTVIFPGLPPSPLIALAAGDAEPVVALLPVSPSTSGGDDEARLQPATALPLERVPAPMSRLTPVAPPRAATSPAVALANTKSIPVVSSNPAVKAAGPMVIEKSLAQGSPHERAEAEYRKAMNVLNMGRLPDAVENLRGALKLDASHAASRQFLFKLLVESKQLDEAAELLQEGLQLQPAQLAWAMSLGRLQVDRSDLPGAWKTLQRSLPAASGSADYQGFAAHVLQRLGRAREAAEFYQAATRLAPTEGRWWLGLGLALEADAHPVEARDALLRARASGTLSAELIALVDQKLH